MTAGLAVHGAGSSREVCSSDAWVIGSQVGARCGIRGDCGRRAVDATAGKVRVQTRQRQRQQQKKKKKKKKKRQKALEGQEQKSSRLGRAEGVERREGDHTGFGAARRKSGERGRAREREGAPRRQTC